MKYLVRLIIACFLTAIPLVAHAELDGNELLQKCEPITRLTDDPTSLNQAEGSGVVYCMGYVDSYIDTFYFEVQAKIIPSVPFCMPKEGVTKKDTVRSVVNYLKSHPDELDYPAGYHLFKGLREAYPCNKKDDKEEAAVKNEDAADKK